MKEYVFEIAEEDSDYVEVFYGWIRKNSRELIRCKDCKHWDGRFCHNKWWGDGYGNYTPPLKTEEGFCDWAERKEHEIN